MTAAQSDPSFQATTTMIIPNTSDIELNSGFPAGYFVIQNVATKRLLDVNHDAIEDGTEINLWPEKEKSLVENFRHPDTNNQVFFIDSSGALCSRSSGHAVDVEDERLVLRHRRPISFPFPNAYAHPLPKFYYSSKTQEISMTFSSDPSYPPPGSGQANGAWQNKTYLLTSIPRRKPRTIIDDASEFITSSIMTPINFFTGANPVPQARPDEVFNGDIDLTEDEVLEEERGSEAEVDDSPEAGRLARVISVQSGDKVMKDLLLSEAARRRRQWVISPLRVKPQAQTRTK